VSLRMKKMNFMTSLEMFQHDCYFTAGVALCQIRVEPGLYNKMPAQKLLCCPPFFKTKQGSCSIQNVCM